MQDLLRNFTENRKTCLCFAKKKFHNTHFSEADYEDIVSTAFEKLLLDAAKPVPTLSKTVATLLYLTTLSGIDLIRKRQREMLACNFPSERPLSNWDTDDLETKNLIELVVAEVSQLNPKRRTLMQLKYHAYEFSTTTSYDEMIYLKSQPRSNCEEMAIELGYASSIALRQDTFRAVSQLRARLVA